MLEDFDKFAHQTAKRQSVLYNILDFINTPGVQVRRPADVLLWSSALLPGPATLCQTRDPSPASFVDQVSGCTLLGQLAS